MISNDKKQEVKRFFLGESLRRPVYIPIVSSYAARLEQVTVGEALKHPSRFVRSYRQLTKLHDFDAIINIGDVTMEAEQLGCKIDWETNGFPKVQSHLLERKFQPGELKWSFDGRIKEALEMTEKIMVLMGGDTAVFGAVTGPLLLSQYLYGPDFMSFIEDDFFAAMDLVDFCKKVNIDLIQRYGKMGVDGVVVVEPIISTLPPDIIREMRAELMTLWNAIRHYRIPSIIITGEAATESSLQALLGIDADGIVFAGIPVKGEGLLKETNKYYSVMLPEGFLKEDPDENCCKQLVNGMLTSKKSFLSGGIPHEANIKTVDMFLQSIKTADSQP